MIKGDHTTAYYKDENVINFTNPHKKKGIINYQDKVWGQVGPKTKIINLRDNVVIESKKENK